MHSRRDFFTRLTSGLFAASAPALFLPKLIKPAWKPGKRALAGLYIENRGADDIYIGTEIVFGLTTWPRLKYTYADGSSRTELLQGFTSGPLSPGMSVILTQ